MKMKAAICYILIAVGAMGCGTKKIEKESGTSFKNPDGSMTVTIPSEELKSMPTESGEIEAKGLISKKDYCCKCSDGKRETIHVRIYIDGLVICDARCGVLAPFNLSKGGC